MKKITKIITATTIAAFTCGFFALNSSSDVMLGNIEALTDGDLHNICNNCESTDTIIKNITQNCINRFTRENLGIIVIKL